MTKQNRNSMLPITPLIGGPELWQTLGFRTSAAFRQALHRKTLPVPVFALKGRAGKFARRVDVEGWLAQIDALVSKDEPAAPAEDGTEDRAPNS